MSTVLNKQHHVVNIEALGSTKCWHVHHKLLLHDTFLSMFANINRVSGIVLFCSETYHSLFLSNKLIWRKPMTESWHDSHINQNSF